jgi:hypothetical protein
MRALNTSYDVESNLYFFVLSYGLWRNCLESMLAESVEEHIPLKITNRTGSVVTAEHI